MSLRDPNVSTPQRRKRVAIVLANPAVSTTTGWPVGFWWSELTHPYFMLTERGYEVEVFSPDGGPCQADALSDPRDPSGYSSSDLITLGFIHSPALTSLVENTAKVSAIDLARFDALIVAGVRRRCSPSTRQSSCSGSSWSSSRPANWPARSAMASRFSDTRSSPTGGISPQAKR